MARQKGIFLVHGSIGNVRNYQMTGDRFITSALKGGPTLTQINTLPQFESCRLRNSEWRGCMMVVHDFYTAFTTLGKQYFDRNFAARIVELIHHVIDVVPGGEFGKRPVLLSEEHPYIYTLVLNPFHLLKTVVSSNVSDSVAYQHNIDRTEMQADLTFGTIKDSFFFRGGETHVKVTQFVALFSDYMYSEANLNYVPMVSFNWPTLKKTESAWLAKSDLTTHTLSLVTQFPEVAYGSPDSETLIQGLFVQMGKDIGGTIYPSANYGFKLLECF